MNPSALFIARPVATTLLTIAVVLAGFFAFLKLPVAPLPQVDYPTITVNASMPGAGPPTMAATVATPLERHLGIIANVVGMSSESSVKFHDAGAPPSKTSATFPATISRPIASFIAPYRRFVSGPHSSGGTAKQPTCPNTSIFL